MNDILNKIIYNKFYIVSFLAVLFLSLYIFEKVRQPDINVVNVNNPTSSESIKEAIPEATNKEAEQIAKKIEEAKPAYTTTTSSKLTDKEIVKVVKNNKSTESATNIVKTDTGTYTTNVYAIDNSKKRTHGIAVFIGSNKDLKSTELGVSYRKDRCIVYIGHDNKLGKSFKVGYELVQW